jgi:hypothetical protein
MKLAIFKKEFCLTAVEVLGLLLPVHVAMLRYRDTDRYIEFCSSFGLHVLLFSDTIQCFSLRSLTFWQ